jgi:hypothetical protein
MIDLNSAPLVKALYRLSRAFGWTPQQIQSLTMGQISLYLQLLDEEAQNGGQI